jgi:hypothetical protein
LSNLIYKPLQTANLFALERNITMPLIQGAHPESIWERTPDPLKWEIVASQDPAGHTVYELKVQCGLGIMRLQFFTEDEIRELREVIGEKLLSDALVSHGG